MSLISLDLALLAEIFSHARKSNTAAKTYVELASVRESRYGGSDERVISARLRQAEALRSAGKFEEASLVVDGIANRLGDTHLLTVKCHLSHGRALLLKGRHSDAEEIFQSVWNLSLDDLPVDASERL